MLHFDPARERWAGVVPSGVGEGVCVQTVLPPDAPRILQRAGFLTDLIPCAKIVGFDNATKSNL